MKRKTLIRTILCMAVSCAALLCTASAYAVLTPESAAAYQSVINDLAGRYGSARTSEEGMYLGLACARLVDFDNDDIPELYCVYGVPAGSGAELHQVLYTYDDGLVKLDIPDRVSNFGTDVSPSTLIYHGLGKAYLVDGQEVMNGNEVRYLAKQGHEIVPAFTYVDGMVGDKRVCRVNGEEKSPDNTLYAINTFTMNMSKSEYSYIAGTDVTVDPTTTLDATFGEIRSKTVVRAEPSAAKVSIGSKSFTLPAYSIQGNNYIKLRDLSSAMNGTAKPFAVDWDGEARQIRVTTGRRGAAAELDALPTAATEAERAATALLFDGKSVTTTAYIIDQSHYYRLRDLAEALGLSVGWDANTKTTVLAVK